MRQNTETITIAIYRLFEMVHRSKINGTVYQDRHWDILRTWYEGI